MTTINSVLARVRDLRGVAVSTELQAAWLLQFERELFETTVKPRIGSLQCTVDSGQLPIEVNGGNTGASQLSTVHYQLPSSYPLDGDVPLLIQSGESLCYDYYIIAMNALNEENDKLYALNLQTCERLLQAWKSAFVRAHMR